MRMGRATRRRRPPRSSMVRVVEHCNKSIPVRVTDMKTETSVVSLGPCVSSSRAARVWVGCARGCSRARRGVTWSRRAPCYTRRLLCSSSRSTRQQPHALAGSRQRVVHRRASMSQGLTGVAPPSFRVGRVATAFAVSENSSRSSIGVATRRSVATQFVRADSNPRRAAHQMRTWSTNLTQTPSTQP